jgi:hypothetical protein
MLLPIKENQTKVRDAINELLFCSAVFFLLVSLSGCGGTKVLKEPEPLAVTQSLATASDQHLSATLDWVIVRDGPGTWAKNVDWDEYLIRVQNLGDDSIRVTNITVTDSLGNRIETRDNRKQLVKGTKEAKRRYKGEGLKVKAGAGVGTLLTAGAVAGAATAAIAGAGVIGLSGGAAAAATGGLILVPVFAVGGVFRGVNNSKVNKQIESRQTLMPVGLQEEEEESFDMFFPLTPSPRQLELTYVDAQGEHVLVVDTKAALEGLHLVQAEE